jgi:two-component system chemotaxis sensor kinase CheA
MSNTLIEQFILESKDYLQRIGEILIALEEEGEDKDLLNELFRLVHTLKGNSGLFDFASMTRLLHASEDLMNLVREGVIPYSSDIADTLLESMDIVSIMIDEIGLMK